MACGLMSFMPNKILVRFVRLRLCPAWFTEPVTAVTATGDSRHSFGVPPTSIVRLGVVEETLFVDLLF
jgi:hypothetical protein